MKTDKLQAALEALETEGYEPECNGDWLCVEVYDDEENEAEDACLDISAIVRKFGCRAELGSDSKEYLDSDGTKHFYAYVEVCAR
jgi:hypothetical protein